MKITVFSDVHGNLPALEKMLEREPGSDTYLFLGDAVNYGPWSNECVDLIASLPNGVRIRGNHEDYYLEGRYDGANPIAQAFFRFCLPRFDRFAEIKKYIPQWQYDGFTCVHTIGGRNIYPDTSITLDGNYFIGHSHHQFRTVSNGYTLYNAGSIGQNRKYINIANYLNWFPEERKVDLLEFVSDVDVVLSEMERLGYPEECMQYYRTKERR